MVEPTGNQISVSSLKQNNARQRVDNEKKSENRASTSDVSTSEHSESTTDTIELSLAQTETADLRPPKQPIDSDDQAFEVINFTKRQISSDHTQAIYAQGNLNPERILELIA